jgi:preprotein translocase SecF subunit
MELFDPKKLNFQFAKSFKYVVTVSIIVSLVCLFAMFVKPGFKYGIDFRGGTEAVVGFKDAQINTLQIRDVLNDKVPGLSIVEVENKQGQSEYKKEFLIIGISENKESVARAFEEGLAKFGTKNSDWTISKLDTVGPKVGGELRHAALWSLIYTALLITLYIYLRFDARFAPGAMIAVVHDLLLTCGFLIFTKTEISTEVVAALLTLAGYSINDTVVVFDRIREVEHSMIGRTKAALIDYAVNSTLSRTMITAAISLVSLAILYFVGGVTLRDFSMTLFVGILVGTYSSIFVAAPLYLWGDKFWGTSGSTAATPKKDDAKKIRSNKMKAAKA